MCGPQNMDSFDSDRSKDQTNPKRKKRKDDNIVDGNQINPQPNLIPLLKTLTARPVTVLDCVPGTPAQGDKQLWILIALGAGEGSVEQITICERDAKFLVKSLSGLIENFSASKLVSAEGPVCSDEWRTHRRHLIWETKARMLAEGPMDFIERIRRLDPDLERYLDQKTKSLAAMLLKNCRSEAVAKRIGEKMLRSWLVTLHVALGFR